MVKVKKAPPMCSWFILSVGVENCEWIFCFFFFYYVVKFIYFVIENTYKFFLKIIIRFIVKEFFNLSIGYSISAAHHLLPYFVTRLFIKFVAVSDCKIILAGLFFIFLVSKLYSSGSKFRAVFRAVFPICITNGFVAIFFKLLRKARPLCPFLSVLLLLPFGATLVLFYIT